MFHSLDLNDIRGSYPGLDVAGLPHRWVYLNFLIAKLYPIFGVEFGCSSTNMNMS